jgi:hypothetical protein
MPKRFRFVRRESWVASGAGSLSRERLWNVPRIIFCKRGERRRSQSVMGTSECSGVSVGLLLAVFDSDVNIRAAHPSPPTAPVSIRYRAFAGRTSSSRISRGDSKQEYDSASARRATGSNTAATG